MPARKPPTAGAARRQIRVATRRSALLLPRQQGPRQSRRDLPRGHVFRKRRHDRGIRQDGTSAHHPGSTRRRLLGRAPLPRPTAVIDQWLLPAVVRRDHLRHPVGGACTGRIHTPAGAHPAGYRSSEPYKTVALCPEAACAAATVVVSPTALSRCTVQQYDGICGVTGRSRRFPADHYRGLQRSPSLGRRCLNHEAGVKPGAVNVR